MEAFPGGPGVHMSSEAIDEMMEREEQEETMEAHRRHRNENRMRSIFRDETVTLVTLEGQLKVCGCFIVLLVAAAGIFASLCAIFYVSLPSSQADFFCFISSFSVEVFCRVA